MTELEQLARELETVDWRAVEGVSASTAAAFATKLREASE